MRRLEYRSMSKGTDMIRQLARAAVLAGLGLSLSGCIAAVAAIPVLAGGGVVGSRVAGGGSDSSENASIPRPPFDSARASVRAAPPVVAPAPAASPTPQPVALAAPATPVMAEPAANELAPQPATAQAGPAQSQLAIGAMPPVALTLPDGTRVEVSGSEAVGAAATNPNAGSAIMATGPGPYRALQDYALANAPRPASRKPRDSVLLTAPGALQPDTAACSVSQPAVLIDLDPGEELLDPTARFAPNPQLSEALAKLRAENVSVHWISGNSAAFAGAIRSRLAEAELDPEGADELVLMRYPDDRKQVRRRAVGATHCLIAIAGDRRRDFDELYAYLKNPEAAAALEPLIGKGWFLVPPALNSKDD